MEKILSFAKFSVTKTREMTCVYLFAAGDSQRGGSLYEHTVATGVRVSVDPSAVVVVKSVEDGPEVVDLFPRRLLGSPLVGTVNNLSVVLREEVRQGEVVCKLVVLH